MLESDNKLLAHARGAPFGRGGGRGGGGAGRGAGGEAEGDRRAARLRVITQ